MNAGFAVVDVETTGLFPGARDRIAEIAVVHVDPDGRMTDRWETLVNPQRDLGPQHIHGIRAEEILDAPLFGEIVPELVGRLRGRTLVAHNVRFDHGFLRAEFGRAGLELPLAVEDCLCTMQLAKSYLPGAGRSLQDCCDSFGLVLDGAHSAGGDAEATAHVLSGYLSIDPENPLWNAALDRGRFAAWPEVGNTGAKVRHRSAAGAGPHFLTRIVDRLPEISGPEEHQAYLSMLDRALVDRHVSAAEAAQLVGLAGELGIGRARAGELHRVYLSQLLALAWQDGIVSPEEVEDLYAVAGLLALDEEHVDRLLSEPRAPVVPDVAVTRDSASMIRPGEKLVLTGAMSSPRDVLITRLSGAGYLVHPAVTKAVKVVVAADPDTLSGKARKAHSYGIPVVGESFLARLLRGT
ncbi:exonuclease domain-containing protein [Arthrobacter sp. NPDC090010]|uniref:3'-5' exonuclease n=1 Tax=Arthrobacter sp. NPDC090010 TaxID=3363942 RepID=UPI0037F10ADC